MSLECMERKSINDAQTIMHKNKLNKEFTEILGRGVTGGWAIAHPVFSRIEGAAGQQRHATLHCITDCPPSIW